MFKGLSSLLFLYYTFFTLLLGLGLSRFAIEMIQSTLPPAAMSWFSFDIDHRVLLYTGLIALFTTLFFGLIPALRVSHANPRSSISSLGSRSSAGKASQRLQSILVVSEIAFALGLLAAGSVMVRGLVRLANESPGFVTKNVLTASLSLSDEQYPKPADRAQFGSTLDEQLKAIPGITDLGFVSEFPLSGSSLSRTYSMEGQTDTSFQSNPDAIYKSASPNYFQTMGIQLLQGRPFLDTDRTGSPLVAIVNQPLASRLWPNENVLGKRLKFDLPSGDSPWVEIVGIVEGTKHQKINRPAPPQIYVAYAQSPSKRLTLAIKTALPAPALIKSVEQQLKSFAPSQALFRVMNLDRYMEEAFWSIRMTTNLFWIFGAIALGLSAIGIYGVMMFSVQERHQEIGIRMALGAVPSQILKLVIQRGLRLGTIGIVLGMIIGVLMTKALAKAILGTSTLDFVSLFYATLILLGSSLLACLIPGMKAAAADPVEVLRQS
jgi:predicted permease